MLLPRRTPQDAGQHPYPASSAMVDDTRSIRVHQAKTYMLLSLGAPTIHTTSQVYAMSEAKDALRE